MMKRINSHFMRTKYNIQTYLCSWIFIAYAISSGAQVRFEKFIWFDFPPTKAKDNFHFYVNAIERDRHYYIFGFNTGPVVASGCNNVYDGWDVFKLDSAGNLKKAIRIGGNLKGERMYYPATATSDKGFVIAGESASFSMLQKCDSIDCNFIKLDSNLNVEWHKSIGGRRIDIGCGIFELKNGGYMAFGMTNSFGHGSNLPYGVADVDIYIMRLDKNGNLMSSFTYGTEYSDVVHAINKDENDNFFIVGRYYKEGINYPFLIKMDSTSNIMFGNFYYFNSSFNKVFSDVVPDSQKNCIYTTLLHEFSDGVKLAMVVLSNSNGSFLSMSKFFMLDSPFGAKFIKKNNFIIKRSYGMYKSGHIILDSSLNNIDMAYKTNTFKEFFNTGIPAMNNLFDLRYLSDNHILTGSCAVLDTNNYTKNYLFISKLNADMESACFPDTSKVEADTVTIQYTVTTGSITSINQGIVMSWTPTVVEGAKDSTICYCPTKPIAIQTQPVNCYSNGSATIMPVSGVSIYQWLPPVSNTNVATNLVEGNYTVTVVDSLGCRNKAVITITTNLSLPLTIKGDTVLCSSSTTTLLVRGASSYSWSTGSTDSSIVIQPITTSTYTVVASGGICTQTMVVTVSVNPTPTVVLSGRDIVINNGDTARISVSGAGSYSIYPASNFIFGDNDLYLYPRWSQQYCVVGERDGCRDSVCIMVRVEGDCGEIEVPNVFTPNGDNVNDEWKINWRCSELVEGVKVQMYDRWGVKVFESEDKFFKWNGKRRSSVSTLKGESSVEIECPTGVYYYVLKWESGGKKMEMKGYVTLLR
jgi:gliding motility-associated-like protein